jgi:hypothetical protein
VRTLTAVTDVSLGLEATYATSHGTLWLWGRNQNGQVLGGTADKVAKPTSTLPVAGRIDALHEGAVVEVAGAAPPQRLTATGGPGSITLRWLWPSTTERFQLNATQGVTSLPTVSTTEHTYTFNGVAGAWEISVGGREFGRASIDAATSP